MILTDNIRGALMMVGAMTAYTVNDAFMKSLSGDMPVFQAIFLRGLGVTLALGLICWSKGQFRARIAPRDRRLIGLRSLAEAASALMFLTALFNMPLANLSAILQALPLTVSLAAALILREPLGWRRLTAILIGFGGVLLIVRPGGADFNIYSLYAVGAVLLVTVRDLAVRPMSRDVPSILVAFVAAGTVCAVAGAVSLLSPWAPLTPIVAAQLLGAMTAILGGYILSVTAMRWGEIGFVAPFRYTSLIVAGILGLLVFGEVPRGLTLIGAAIVVATGLFTLYRERRLKVTPSLPRIPGRMR